MVSHFSLSVLRPNEVVAELSACLQPVRLLIFLTPLDIFLLPHLEIPAIILMSSYSVIITDKTDGESKLQK